MHATIKILTAKTVWLLLFILSGILPATAASTADQIAAIRKQKDDAVFSVEHIVNQPVTHLPRTPNMDVAIYTPGWFHDGAITPDFDHVDIRTSQEFPYQGRHYVSSNLNPTEAFLGDELEFNSMTKFFYTDRSLPEKKLTTAEMEEINGLYRVIGRCNQQLFELQNPDPPLTQIHTWMTQHKPAVFGAVVGLLVIIVIMRKLRTPAADN